MKKIIYLLMIIPIIFVSCEVEKMDDSYGLENTDGKGKISKEKSEEESYSEDGKCETAFGRYCPCASLNTCFIDMDYGFNRWGWSVELDNKGETITERKTITERFGLYAGVGQCDMTKGTAVGHVYVTFKSDGSVAHDEPVMNPGFTLKEFHFYAGDTEVPIGKNGKSTVAPGQYYNEGDYDDDGVVYVILHAVICGDFEE